LVSHSFPTRRSSDLGQSYQVYWQDNPRVVEMEVWGDGCTLAVAVAVVVNVVHQIFWVAWWNCCECERREMVHPSGVVVFSEEEEREVELAGRDGNMVRL